MRKNQDHRSAVYGDPGVTPAKSLKRICDFAHFSLHLSTACNHCISEHSLKISIIFHPKTSSEVKEMFPLETFYPRFHLKYISHVKMKKNANLLKAKIIQNTQNRR